METRDQEAVPHKERYKRSKTLEELAAEQGVKGPARLEDLAQDIMPPWETPEMLNDWVRAHRRGDFEEEARVHQRVEQARRQWIAQNGSPDEDE